MDELEAGVEFAVAVVSSSSAFLQPGAVISCRNGMPILPYLHEPRLVRTSSRRGRSRRNPIFSGAEPALSKSVKS